MDFAQLVHQLFPQLRSAVAQQLGADPQLWHTLAVSLLADYPDLERDDLLAALELGALAAGVDGWSRPALREFLVDA